MIYGPQLALAGHYRPTSPPDPDRDDRILLVVGLIGITVILGVLAFRA